MLRIDLVEVQQFRDRQVEGLGEDRQMRKPDVSFTPLDHPDVGAMKASGEGELFLRLVPTLLNPRILCPNS
jgi:hypothetical protein